MEHVNPIKTQQLDQLDQLTTCKVGCGACCIAPSISSVIPGMPNGKKAGERCVQLDSDNLCKLFGLSERPLVCSRFMPQIDLCTSGFQHAMHTLSQLEKDTSS